MQHSAGTSAVTVLQNPGVDAAACWVELGTYSFVAGTSSHVSLSSTGVSGELSADAIAFVRLANEVPVADAGGDLEVIDTDANGTELVTLDGSGSSDPDGDTLTYVWRDETDTLLSESASPELTLSVGVDVITLTVTDTEGASADASVQVTVLAATDPTDPTDSTDPTDPTDPSDPTGPEVEAPSQRGVSARVQGCAAVGGGNAMLLLLALPGLRRRRTL